MKPNAFEIFFVFLKLGLTSFGGPVAHLGIFHDEFVTKKRWINEHAYADLVLLCQFLPGPASSQVGIALGYSKRGLLGAVAAWLGFTLPSAVLLVLFGLGIANLNGTVGSGWLHGLKVSAVAIVAHAVWSMAVKLCPDWRRASVAVASTVVCILVPAATTQIFAILVAGLVGKFFLKEKNTLAHMPIHAGTRRLGFFSLVLFFAILFAAPIVAKNVYLYPIQLFDSFYRVGSLVFGGGHVVLPLLQAEVVPSGWVSKDLFMAGYGAAQAIPGPLFSFSAYLGSVSNNLPNGWIGAFIALTAVFLPSFLLVIGVLPYWEALRRITGIRSAMLGINAAVVGLLLAAFYDPVWKSAIFSPKDLVIAVSAFALLQFLRFPSWGVVFLCAICATAF